MANIMGSPVGITLVPLAPKVRHTLEEWGASFSDDGVTIKAVRHEKARTPERVIFTSVDKNSGAKRKHYIVPTIANIRSALEKGFTIDPGVEPPFPHPEAQIRKLKGDNMGKIQGMKVEPLSPYALRTLREFGVIIHNDQFTGTKFGRGQRVPATLHYISINKNTGEEVNHQLPSSPSAMRNYLARGLKVAENETRPFTKSNKTEANKRLIHNCSPR